MSTKIPNLVVHSVNPDGMCASFEPGSPAGNDGTFTKYGEAIDVIAEDTEGRMFALCEDEPMATQINYHPLTGRRAITLRDGDSLCVPMPRTSEEARAMVRVGMEYLSEHAPHMLTYDNRLKIEES